MPYMYPTSMSQAAMGYDYATPGSTVDPVTPNYNVGFAQDVAMTPAWEADEYGRYGITDAQKKRAMWGAAGNILTGISAAMLGKDPMRVTAAVAQAGDTYQQELDAASARNVAARTLQFQEARSRLELEHGLTQLERDTIALDDVKKRAQQDDDLRLITYEVGKDARDLLEIEIADALDGGRMKPEEAALVRSISQKSLDLIRIGRGDLANIEMTQIASHIPPDRLQPIVDALNNGVLVKKTFERMNPGMTLDPEGNPISIKDVERMEKTRDLQLKQAGANLRLTEANIGAIAAGKPDMVGQRQEAQRLQDVVELSNKAMSLAGNLQSKSPHQELDEDEKKTLAALRGATGLSDQRLRKALSNISAIPEGAQILQDLLVGVAVGNAKARAMFSQLADASPEDLSKGAAKPQLPAGASTGQAPTAQSGSGIPPAALLSLGPLGPAYHSAYQQLSR